MSAAGTETLLQDIAPVNVGIPGPRVRSACQHPERLEDILIDFKGLTIIDADGPPLRGTPEAMLKWPDLYLSNSAYLAKYMDRDLVAFMRSARGSGHLPFASDHPILAMEHGTAACPSPPTPWMPSWEVRRCASCADLD